MVKIFDFENGELVPTIHCETLKSLRSIKERYKKDYMQVYLYLHYMTSTNPDNNPFFNYKEYEKESKIFEQLGDVKFSPEDPEVVEGLKFLKEVYSTPISRAYEGAATALDNISDYLKDTSITDGRDGNINQITNTLKNFEMIRKSFKGAYEDLMEEQKSSVRGGQKVAYDQQKYM